MKRGDIVAQLVVRNIESQVKQRLRHRAALNGRSMEEEVRDILRNAVNETGVPSGGLGSEISTLFAKHGLRSDIPELRGHTITPAMFE